MTAPNEDARAKHRAKMIDAEERGSMWLADGNEHAEAGRWDKAEMCYQKSQYWLDRYNRLAGNS